MEFDSEPNRTEGNLLFSVISVDETRTISVPKKEILIMCMECSKVCTGSSEVSESEVSILNYFKVTPVFYTTVDKQKENFQFQIVGIHSK